jgi:hypothetical protein
VLTPTPAARDLLKRLHRGKATIGLLATLTDDQLDSVPPAVDGSADGHRNLEVLIDDIIAQQAARLVALKRAVA